MCVRGGGISFFYPLPLRHPNRRPSNKRRLFFLHGEEEKEEEEDERAVRLDGRGRGRRKGGLVGWVGCVLRGREVLEPLLGVELSLSHLFFFGEADCQHRDRDKWGQFMGREREEAADRQSSARNKRRKKRRLHLPSFLSPFFPRSDGGIKNGSLSLFLSFPHAHTLTHFLLPTYLTRKGGSEKRG